MVFFFTPFFKPLVGWLTGGPDSVAKMDSLIGEIKRLFDIGFCGFCVNTAVFVLVSLVTRRPDPKRVEELARIMDGKDIR